jgi:pimeloyl-ACP methyl ester carboxylesterase
MKRFLKITRWIFIIVASLLVLALLAVEGLDRYVSSDKGARWMYRNVNREVEVLRTPSGLRYLQIGDHAKPALMLLHGSPGSLMDWRKFAQDDQVYEHYRILIPERPGYGATKPRKAEPSIVEQSRRCMELVNMERQAVTIMGYSYGGSVGLAMAGMSPDKVNRFIGVAGQYDPDSEMTMSISYYIRFAIFKYLLPRWLWVSNVEKLGHPQALKDALPLFDQVSCPVDLIHGYPDMIVPYANSPWIQERLQFSARLYSLDGIGHELPFEHMDTLVQLALHPERFFKPTPL